MEKLHGNQELLKAEQRTWTAWRDHFTACSQCLNANAAEAVLSRGCTKGRAIWCDWHIAYRAYCATLEIQRRTA